MKNIFYFFAFSALFLFTACQNSDQEAADNGNDQEVEAPVDTEAQLMADIDAMVRDLATDPALDSKRNEQYQTSQLKGTVEGMYKNGQVRILRFSGQTADGMTELDRNLYLSASGTIRYLNELSKAEPCDANNQQPCLKETKVYFDENGNAVAAFERQKQLEDGATTDLSAIEFTENYDFDRFNDLSAAWVGSLSAAAENKTTPASAQKEEKKSDSSSEKKPAPAPSMARINFNGNSAASVSGSLSGTQTKAYRIKLTAGKTVNINLNAAREGARFMLQDTGGKRISPAKDSWQGAVSRTGDYVIKVFLNQAENTSGGTGYELTVTPM